MSVKMLGRDFLAFWTGEDALPEDAWVDDEMVSVDGETIDPDAYGKIAPDARVKVSGGVVFHGEHDREGKSLESILRRWLKARTTATILVSVDLHKADAVRAAITAAGGKIEKGSAA